MDQKVDYEEGSTYGRAILLMNRWIQQNTDRRVIGFNVTIDKIEQKNSHIKFRFFSENDKLLKNNLCASFKLPRAAPAALHF